MDGTPLEFAPTVRFVRRPHQSLVLDLATRRWLRMTSPGLAAVERRVGGAVNGHPAVESATNGSGPAPESDEPPAERVDEAVAFLLRHGFLRRAGEGPSAVDDGAAPSPASRTLQIHVTHRCNLACPTCYAADFLSSGPRDLTVEQIERVMELASANGFDRLTLTGGEPLLRRDLPEILAAGRPRFRWLALTTNGTALTPRRARELVGVLDHLNVSVDGPEAEIHDAIRGPGAFDRTLAGLRNLLEAGFPGDRVSLNPTVTLLNHERLDEVVDLAASFGADASFGFFMPTGRGLCNLERFNLSPADMLGLFERAVVRTKRRLGVPEDLSLEEDPELAFSRVSTDCSVDSILAIQADGSVFPCPNLNQPEHELGNVLELDDDELVDLMTGGEGKAPYRCRVVDRVPGCRRCEARHFCGGGCMANAYMVTGDLYGRDPYCGFYRSVWRRYGPLREDYLQTAAAGTEEAAP